MANQYDEDQERIFRAFETMRLVDGTRPIKEKVAPKVSNVFLGPTQHHSVGLRDGGTAFASQFNSGALPSSTFGHLGQGTGLAPHNYGMVSNGPAVLLPPVVHQHNNGFGGHHEPRRQNHRRTHHEYASPHHNVVDIEAIRKGLDVRTTVSRLLMTRSTC